MSPIHAPMDLSLKLPIGLLIAAIVVAIVARRLRLPYTVGLVVAGIGLALLKIPSGAGLTHDLIFDILLPPLLFEASLSIHWSELRRDWLPVTLLSTIGVAVSAVVVATGMVLFLHWQTSSAVVFGVLIAATDPVAVIALFKDSGLKGRLLLLVESESLLNDGVAAVFFSLSLAWAASSGAVALSGLGAMESLILSALGGILAGLLSGAAAIAVAGRTADHLVETALTAVAAYGSFQLAEHFHLSGVLATVAAGLVMGNAGILSDTGERGLSERGRDFVVAFWDFAAFLANSAVFLLIGLKAAEIAFAGLGFVALLTTIGLVLAGRALTIYPLCALFRGGAQAISMREQHVLWWGGLRGALALALALGLPPGFPMRSEILIAAFAVVVFSVVVQGLTMKLLLKRLGFRF